MLSSNEGRVREVRCFSNFRTRTAEISDFSPKFTYFHARIMQLTFVRTASCLTYNARTVMLLSRNQVTLQGYANRLNYDEVMSTMHSESPKHSDVFYYVLDV